MVWKSRENLQDWEERRIKKSSKAAKLDKTCSRQVDLCHYRRVPSSNVGQELNTLKGKSAFVEANSI